MQVPADSLSRCRNGFIDKAELRDLLESTDNGLQPATQHWLADSVVSSVLQSYDKDGDNQISFEEFCGLVSDVAKI